MDQKYNTNDDATVELKKSLRKSPPRNNPNMSDAAERSREEKLVV